MRMFSTLIASAMLIAAFGSATMAEELKDCAGQYDPKTGTNFARCPGMAFEVGIQGSGGPAGAAAPSSGGSTGGSATAGK